MQIHDRKAGRLKAALNESIPQWRQYGAYWVAEISKPDQIGQLVDAVHVNLATGEIHSEAINDGDYLVDILWDEDEQLSAWTILRTSPPITADQRAAFIEGALEKWHEIEAEL